jgi:MFS family permease
MNPSTASSETEGGSSNPGQGHRGAYKWCVVAMLWLICFFNYADRQAIYSVFPMLAKEFAFDKVQLGLIGSAFMWVYAAGAPVAGFICDRVRRKDLILAGCIFWSLVTITTGWCTKLWHFVTVRALEGFGETFYFPASMSLTSDYHGQRTRSRALSLHQSSVYIGTIVGSWLAAWLAEHYGWRVGFYLFGTLGILLAIVLYLFLREPKRGEADTAAPADQGHQRHGVQAGESSSRSLSVGEILKLIWRTPTLLLLMLAFAAANFVATIFLTWTPTFLVEKFHFKLTSAGLSGTVFIHLASAASVPLAGWLADRLAQRFVGGRMMVQALGLIAGSFFVVQVGTVSDTTSLLVSMTLFGLCKGFYDSGIFASLYDVVEPRARGTIAGLMNTVGWTGGSFGPLFVGFASKYGSKPTEVENMSNAIAWCGPVYIIAALLLGLAIWTVRSRGQISGAAAKSS